MRKTCSKCYEAFDLLPNKPGFVNVCPTCTEDDRREARKTATAEALRKSLTESVRINTKAREKSIKDDAELESLGLERVPGKRIIAKVPNH